MMVSAAADDSLQRFIARAIEQEAVWFLENDEGAAYVDSARDEEAVVLLFWSERADAKRARKTEFKEFEVAEIALLEFLFKWLSGMAEDEVLVGVNWTGAPEELELDPEHLQDELLEAMGDEMRETYYDALQAALDPTLEPSLDPAEQADGELSAP